MPTLKLYRAAEMRALDAAAVAAGVSGQQLMEAAGEAVARQVLARVHAGGRVAIACGPGNNGGDGFVVARLLAADGFDVVVGSARPLAEMRGDAAAAAAAWTGETVPLAGFDPTGADLVVDALYGTGLVRGVEGDAAAAIERINASGVPVLAVDVPSGLDSDTGEVRAVAIRADATVTLVAGKPGLLLGAGPAQAGELIVADIGMPEEVLAAHPTAVAANDPDLWREHLPKRDRSSHKYDRGHALVVSGPPAHTGAARMAARAALRAGAGLVTVVTSARALSVNAAHLTAVMLTVADDPDGFSDLLADERLNAIALGPALGVGENTRGWVSAALEADRATVLDADALTTFAGRAEELAGLIGGDRAMPVVLTPHAGEFKRLFDGAGETSDAAKAVLAPASKLDRCLAAAAFTGAVVVFKGADTVIAAPDGRAAINRNGSPHLATAGSGDVLSGIVCGLLAQGMDGFEAACAGVWMHADAASRFGPGLIAEDLPDQMPAVLRAFYPG